MKEARLRSVYEPGTWQWAMRRAQWRSMGISDEDFYKPKIAVINSSSNLSVCYVHLDEVSKIVQEAIREGGGLPFEVHTAAPSDIVTSAGREGRYLMPTRDLVVNDIEVMVEGALLDGMVCLSSCDKTIPAHLMAAARLNIPTLILACGYQMGGQLDSGVVDIEDVYESVGAVKGGTMSLEHLQRMTEVAICAPGVCAGLGTANSMQIMSEALGMALPGSTPIRGGSDKLLGYARKAGRRIVEMIREQILPRQIITPASIENAVRVAQAIGASVNCVRHLTALAVEAELDLDVVSLFERLADDSVLICSVRPNGPHRTEDMEAAGGTLAVMKQLSSKLRTDVLTCTGKLLRDVLSEAVHVDEKIIRPLSAPFSKHSGLVIVRGNLAPEGAIVKLSAVPQDMWTYRGSARVYEDEEQAIADITKIREGEVVVLRGLGPKGGPGTVFACSFVAAANGAGIGRKIAVVTDGELSGLNRGLTIGQVMPEAAEGGPLAVVKDGDEVAIDLVKRRVDLLLDDDIIRARLAAWKPKPRPTKRSWLSIYAQVVQPMSKGAVLGAMAKQE